MSIITKTDSYKMSQFLQYPPGTTAINSYIEARGGEDKSVFFGLQAFIQEYLLKPITMEDVNKAEKLITAHGEPFNREGWEIIVNEYDGYLPLMIEAVPEGTYMDTGNVQVQVQNTDHRMGWLTSYVETAMLRAVWYPSTVATMSRKMKLLIAQALDKTSDIPVMDQLPFKLHDFGARGVSSGESAGAGGAGHLVNFMGTDTFEGVEWAMKYYDTEVCGFSIPASEHSTITSWGSENELDAFKNMVEQFAGEGKIYACVSDSYNIWEAVEEKWPSLREEIMAKGGTLVVRPDSGDPLTVPVQVIEKLMNKFGYEYNSKGYKVLPPYIRVIQGDGITHESLPKLISNLISAGISLDNIAFGMGGGLLQNVTRDTLKYAMKASAIRINAQEWRDVYKDPIDAPDKKSKKGLLGLVENCGIGSCSFKTVPQKIAGNKNLLRRVYLNGEAYNEDTFEEIRKRAQITSREIASRSMLK